MFGWTPDEVEVEECPDCDGKGRAASPPHWVSETCETCEGSGEVETESPPVRFGTLSASKISSEDALSDDDDTPDTLEMWPNTLFDDGDGDGDYAGHLGLFPPDSYPHD